MATNVTEKSTNAFNLIKNKNSNTNKMLINTFSNLRCIMVRIVLCKNALFT